MATPTSSSVPPCLISSPPHLPYCRCRTCLRVRIQKLIIAIRLDGQMILCSGNLQPCRTHGQTSTTRTMTNRSNHYVTRKPTSLQRIRRVSGGDPHLHLGELSDRRSEDFIEAKNQKQSLLEATIVPAGLNQGSREAVLEGVLLCK